MVLYLLSLLGLLQFGHFIIMAVWLAGGVYFGVRAGWRAIRRALFSPGFLLFVGGSCFLWVLFALQQPMFTQWDEFTAWGLAPKMVAERAALYVADPINLTASFTYPATSLVSYLFQRVPGQFYEWQCLAGLDILFLACIAPAAAMPRKNWAGAVLVFAAGFLLPFFFSVVPAGTPSTMYANAMADTPLALLFGGTLCLYAAAGGRKTGFFACAMPLAVLTMTKDIGFAYALIVTFLIGLDQLFGTPHPDTKPARIFGVSLAKCSILAAVVLAVFRFRKNLLTDEGYVMFTLPVSPHSLVCSKLIVSTVWFLGAVVIDVVALVSLVADVAMFQEMGRMFREVFDNLTAYYLGNGVLFLVELVILFLVGCAYTCLSFYTPLAIGHSFAQHKMLLSVAFFFAIEVVVQIISGIALIAGLPALDNLFFWANTNLSPAGAIHGFMWGCIGYTAVFTVVLYCLTIRMLHRHLNLE